MDKRQQWIVGALAVVAAVMLGMLSYRTFSGYQEPLGLRKSLLDQAGRATVPGTDGFDSGTLPAILEVPITVDGVVAGMEADLVTETELLEAEVSEATEAIERQDDGINELDQAYDENQM